MTEGEHVVQLAGGILFEFVLARSAPSRLIVSQQRNKTCQGELYFSMERIGRGCEARLDNSERNKQVASGFREGLTLRVVKGCFILGTGIHKMQLQAGGPSCVGNLKSL